MEYYDEQKIYLERLKMIIHPKINVGNKPIQKRLPKIQYHCEATKLDANQSTCLRRKFGARIVDPSGTVVSTGYNGAPRKMTDCLERGWCWRDDHQIPSGEHYERCFSIHAEGNATIQAGKQARGCTMYISGFDAKTGKVVEAMPCFMCAKTLLNAELKSIIIETPTDYREYTPQEIYEMRVKEIMV
jgi:dCMP deaminase